MVTNFNLEYRERTKKFALRIIKLFQCLPKNDAAKIMGKQLLRSGTSVGANFRAACRARSKAEYISKLNIALEEADESCYWIELLIDSGIMPIGKLSPLLNESLEITKVFSVSSRTARENKNDKKILQ